MTQHQSVASPTEWVVVKESQAAKLSGRAQGLLLVLMLPDQRFPASICGVIIARNRYCSTPSRLRHCSHQIAPFLTSHSTSRPVSSKLATWPISG